MRGKMEGRRGIRKKSTRGAKKIQTRLVKYEHAVQSRPKLR